jgi:hypothetical protein
MTVESILTNVSSNRVSKAPRQILNDLFAFSPNRETLGGTAYFIKQNSGNILVDCPIWDQTTQDFITDQGGIRYLFFTHRGGIGQKVKEMQQIFKFEAVIQEQEAYLLPEIEVKTFRDKIILTEICQGIWTAGFSPGSACLYCDLEGGILFSGRHLLPDPTGEIKPIRTDKTFHWQRQLRNVEKINNLFNCTNLKYICPGGNTGFLKGKIPVHLLTHISQS